MKKILVAVAVAAALGAPATATARGEDLVNCRWQNGMPLGQNVCASLRRAETEEREKKAREKEQLRQASEYEARRKEQEQAEKDRVLNIIRERDEQEAQIRTKEEAEYAKYKQEEARREQRSADQTKVKKERCGTDYGSPRIGMTIERAQDCVGNFKLVSQLNRVDGVVSTYRAGRIHLHVMNGKIGAWDRH